MKKIAILAGAVLLAAASQAATCSWTMTNVYAGNAVDKATGIAYFMTTGMAAMSAWTSDLTAADAATLVGSAYSWTPTVAGTYSISSANAVPNATLGLADSTSYTMYAVIFNGSTIANSTSFYLTNSKTSSTMTGTSNLAIAFGTQLTGSQASWTTMSVPEPTSGLLLLLGMAGLALKRKNA